MKLLYMFMLLQQEAAEAAGDEGSFINGLVERFNEGNSGGPYMWPILICLIIGLAIAFERIITLNRADINTRKFIVNVKESLEDGGIPAAEEVCANTRGPVASVFQAGLLRADEGIEAVEKAVISYGSIEMSFLERGLVWLSLFISIAPMFGFLGTVVGMVAAFDAIETAGGHLAGPGGGRYQNRAFDDGLRPYRGHHPPVLLQLLRLEDRPHRGRDGRSLYRADRLARAAPVRTSGNGRPHGGRRNNGRGTSGDAQQPSGRRPDRDKDLTSRSGRRGGPGFFQGWPTRAGRLNPEISNPPN